jgi:hypothetical protein
LKKRFNDGKQFLIYSLDLCTHVYLVSTAGDVKLLEDEELHDVHAISGLLKMWLRELPESILTEALLGDFLNSIRKCEKYKQLAYFINSL